VLKNFWYVVAEGSAVGTKPVKVRALGQDLVVFRRTSDLTAVVLSNTCVHRMGSLADGVVVGDCVRCPYHGWTYGMDGACTSIPANPPGTVVPKKARVDSYPVEERYGWIWAFLGDLPAAERPPIPPLPELDQPGWRSVRGEVTWAAHYARVVENAVDIAHTPFLHASSFGNAEHPIMPDYEVEAGEGSLSITVTLEAPTRKGLAKLLWRGGQNRVTLAIHMPSVNRIETTFANGWRMVLLLANLPVDEHTTLTRFIQVRSFMRSPLADGIARRFSLRILREDRAAVESQHPSVMPTAPGAELGTRSDALSIAYRKLRAEHVERGWQIDHGAVRRACEEDGRLLVIPSPRRRDPQLSSAWVLDEAPTR
jgi:phenylpropionate dioxygenase-like ring-hydroxylating dioxygenase large terminal subunit